MSHLKKEPFPVVLFASYVLFYAGQAIYGTYLNLYLSEVCALSKTQIGFATSLPVAFLLFTQLFWGVASDKAKSKNRLLATICVLVAAMAMMFYLPALLAEYHIFGIENYVGTTWHYVYLIVVLVLFDIVYSPLINLQDNLTLELLGDYSRWNFGQIRLGGTLGYALCSLVIGYLLSSYTQIFYLKALFMLMSGILPLFLPRISGHRTQRQKVDYRKLLQNKAILAIIFLSLVFNLGMQVFYSYYSIYITQEFHASMSDVSTLMFICSIAEVPFLLFSNKLIRRFGYQKVLIIAGVASAARWLMLYLFTNMYAIYAANLLHGMGYIGFSVCTMLFITENVPEEMRATALMANGVISMIFSRLIFGSISGWLSDLVGVNNMMLVMAVLMGSATVIFFFWMKALRKHKSAPAAV